MLGVLSAVDKLKKRRVKLVVDEKVEEETFHVPAPQFVNVTLTTEERERCVSVLEEMGLIRNVDELHVALTECGQNSTEDEVVRDLHSLGFSFETSTHLGIDDFIALMSKRKTRHLELMHDPELDTLEAFVSLGGDLDRSGTVPADLLAHACNAFDLDIDLQSILAEVEADNSNSGSNVGDEEETTGFGYKKLKGLMKAIDHKDANEEREFGRLFHGVSLDVDLETELEKEMPGTKQKMETKEDRWDMGGKNKAARYNEVQQLYQKMTQQDEERQKKEKRKRKEAQSRFMAPTASSGVVSISWANKGSKADTATDSDSDMTDDTKSRRTKHSDEQDSEVGSQVSHFSRSNNDLGKMGEFASAEFTSTENSNQPLLATLFLNKLVEEKRGTTSIGTTQGRLENIMFKHMHKIISNNHSPTYTADIQEILKRRNIRSNNKSPPRYVVYANGDIPDTAKEVKLTKAAAPSFMKRHEQDLQNMRELIEEKVKELTPESQNYFHQVKRLSEKLQRDTPNRPTSPKRTNVYKPKQVPEEIPVSPIAAFNRSLTSNPPGNRIRKMKTSSMSPNNVPAIYQYPHPAAAPNPDMNYDVLEWINSRQIYDNVKHNRSVYPQQSLDHTTTHSTYNRPYRPHSAPPHLLSPVSLPPADQLGYNTRAHHSVGVGESEASSSVIDGEEQEADAVTDVSGEEQDTTNDDMVRNVFNQNMKLNKHVSLGGGHHGKRKRRITRFSSSNITNKTLPNPQRTERQKLSNIKKRPQSAPLLRKMQRDGDNDPDSQIGTGSRTFEVRVYIENAPQSQDHTVTASNIDQFISELNRQLLVTDETGKIYRGATRIKQVYLYQEHCNHWKPVMTIRFIPSTAVIRVELQARHETSPRQYKAQRAFQERQLEYVNFLPGKLKQGKQQMSEYHPHFFNNTSPSAGSETATDQSFTDDDSSEGADGQLPVIT